MSTLGIKYEDYGNLRIDGKPMFKPEQLKKENEADRAADVVAATLSSKQVTFLKDGKETLLNPNVIGTEKDSQKGVIDKIIDFFRSLVGLGPKEMAQDKINRINSKNNEEKAKYEAKSRERISFDELSGLKAAKKLTTPPKQNTLSAEKKGPSVGK